MSNRRTPKQSNTGSIVIGVVLAVVAAIGMAPAVAPMLAEDAGSGGLALAVGLIVLAVFRIIHFARRPRKLLRKGGGKLLKELTQELGR